CGEGTSVRAELLRPGPGAGSPVGTTGKGAAARAPDVRPRPYFRGRRGGRGVLAAGREARGRPAGQGEGFRPRPRAGGWPGPAGSRARGGGRESGPRSKGKHVCGAAAEAGAGRRGRSLQSPRPPPAGAARPAPAAPPRVPVSSPRARGRAATPSSSRPRPRASHSSPHSSHSRLPPFKPQAGGGEGPQLPAPPCGRVPQRPRRPPGTSAEPRLEERRRGGLRGTGPARPPTSPHPGTGPTGAPPSGALEGTAGTITSNEWSSPNSPEGSNVSGGSQALDKPIDNDAEGVWSPDIEQSFQEALAIYPPCGRRKIILSDEGKMYGRNELIARYIKLRTGKTRTRKQVSSHIQVLARRKAREIQAKLKDQAAKDKALQSMAAMSSAQIISATAFHSKMALTRGPGYPAVSGFWQGALPGHAGTSHDVKPFSQQTYAVQPSLPLPGFESAAGASPSPSAPPAPPWQGRSVASPKLWMLEFSAFLERQQDPDTYNKHLFVHIGQSSPSYSDPYLEAVDIRQIYDKFPERKGGLKELFERGPSNAFFLVKFWADLNTSIEDEGSSFYGVSSQYESPENMTITCSTKVCSFGKQVVEKVETEYARYENGHYSYRIHRSPLCEYMINFIHKLKHLPEKYMMNSVLENFTILQVVTNRDTQETLLCVAYVFEVSASEHGAQHHIYRLVKE
ncbi:transcriptional enhancer factor TEF-3, partial [Megaptera novaeangliae]